MNNFTNDAIWHNCDQLKQLIFNESLVYPEDFCLYFPYLEPNFCYTLSDFLKFLSWTFSFLRTTTVCFFGSLIQTLVKINGYRLILLRFPLIFYRIQSKLSHITNIHVQYTPLLKFVISKKHSITWSGKGVGAYTPRSIFVLLIIFLLGLLWGCKITKSFDWHFYY